MCQSWRFSHDKLREAIKDSLSHQLHHELHRRVAEGMEAINHSTPEYAAILTHHWFVAGDRDKELHYATIAADQAAKSNASKEAIALFERALKLLLTQEETPERDRQELALQVGLGSQLAANRGANAPGVGRAYARVRELAVRTGQIDLLSQATWGDRR